MINIVLVFLMSCIPVLIAVAFLTLMERKMLSLIGLRLGPNKVLMGGIGQPILDAGKLMKKQINSLMNFNYNYYYFSSSIMIISSILIWISVTEDNILSPKNNLIMVMILLGLNSVGSIICGWSAFSKFSLIGSIRTVSLLVSYESVLYIILLLSVYVNSSFDMGEFESYKYPFLVLSCLSFLIWWPAMLADLNRTPYDFSEGESELVSGFNTEFGSSSFTMIFLAEYSNILFFSYLTWVLFVSSSSVIFPASIILMILWIRAVLPRYRFDKLMTLAWKVLIPLTTIYLVASISLWA